MTERKPPDDRELEQYLKGESPLSRRYRDASGESSPPDLDEAILARSRAELKRKPPSLNRYLAPVALAASVVLGVNLAWNLQQVEPVPTAAPRLEKSAEPAYAPDPPPATQQAPAPVAAAPEARRRAAPASPKLEDARPAEGDIAAATRERVAREAYAESQERKASQSADAAAGAAAPSSAPSAAFAPAPPPLTEAQKIDRLIGHVRGLEGAVFIRNGREHTAEDAAKHMQLKRDKAGEHCDTAEEFIRVCASFSSRSGEAYLIRLPDGRTRTAEDVLREALAQIEGR